MFLETKTAGIRTPKSTYNDVPLKLRLVDLELAPQVPESQKYNGVPRNFINNL